MVRASFHNLTEWREGRVCCRRSHRKITAHDGMEIAKHDAVVRRLYQNDTMLSATYDDESTMDITQNVIITAYVFLIVTTSVCRVASFKAKRRSKLMAVAVHKDTGPSV